MKKYIYCAFIALITLACNQDDELSFDNTSLVIPDTFYGQTPVYNKSRALTDVQPESWDDTENVNSRTYAVKDENGEKNPALGIQGEYFQYWSENDPISIFFTTQNLKYELKSYKNDEDQDVGVFKIVGPKNKGYDIETGYYYSVYPYRENTQIDEFGYITYIFPETQHYNQHSNEYLENLIQGDSYSNRENAMVAIEPKATTDSILYFQNFCSYLQLQLVDSLKQYTNKTIDKIILVANNEADKLAGTSAVELVTNKNQEAENIPFTPVVTMKQDGTNKITLECDNVPLSQDQNNPSKFWFVLPGEFTFSEGFVITVIFDDQTYFRKATKKTIEIERSHIKPMAPVNPKPEEPTGPIFYKYKDRANDPLTFPVENTFYGEDGLRLEVIGQRFIEETKEWMILLSGTLKAIGGNSFPANKWDKDLDYVRVRNGNESINIDSHAFYDCLADSVIVHNDVDNIEEKAFQTSTITDLKIHGDVNTFMTNTGLGSMITNIDVDGNVQKFDKDAFNNCDYLKTIEILSEGFNAENNSNTIGESAFNDCDNLEQVYYPMVKTIETKAFDGCNKLETVNIQEATAIGTQAFNGCNSLETVTVTKVEQIEAQAFNECTSLSTINLSSVEYIRNDAFFNCSSLINVDLSSIIEIGWNAFTSTGLTTITIPSSCTKIGEGAFNKCGSLLTAYCEGSKPPYIDTDNTDDSYVFGQVHPDFHIYVPYDRKRIYINDNVFGTDKTNWWKKYESKIIEMNQQTNP